MRCSPRNGGCRRRPPRTTATCGLAKPHRIDPERRAVAASASRPSATMSNSAAACRSGGGVSTPKSNCRSSPEPACASTRTAASRSGLCLIELIDHRGRRGTFLPGGHPVGDSRPPTETAPTDPDPHRGHHQRPDFPAQPRMCHIAPQQPNEPTDLPARDRAPMAEATLLISSKNYSSWSLRGIPAGVRMSGLTFFEERTVDPRQLRHQGRAAAAMPPRSACPAWSMTASRCGIPWRSPNTSTSFRLAAQQAAVTTRSSPRPLPPDCRRKWTPGPSSAFRSSLLPMNLRAFRPGTSPSGPPRRPTSTASPRSGASTSPPGRVPGCSASRAGSPTPRAPRW